MYKNVRELYRNLTADQKNDFLSWAEKEFEMKASSVKVNWMYGGSIPDKYKDQVIQKLETYK